MSVCVMSVCLASNVGQHRGEFVKCEKRVLDFL